MRLVQQRAELDCGVACATMVSGASYAQAAALAPRGMGRRGIYPKELAAMLKALTGQPWQARVVRPRRPLVEHTSWEASPIVLMLERGPGEKIGHFVVIAGGLVLDPRHVRARPIRSYPLRHWLLTRAVEPSNDPTTSSLLPL